MQGAAKHKQGFLKIIDPAMALTFWKTQNYGDSCAKVHSGPHPRTQNPPNPKPEAGLNYRPFGADGVRVRVGRVSMTCNSNS